MGMERRTRTVRAGSVWRGLTPLLTMGVLSLLPLQMGAWERGGLELSTAEAQELAPPALDRPFTAGAGATFQYFSFGDSQATGFESISLLTTPFAARARFGQRVRAELRGTWARAGMERVDGSEITISGPTDAQLRMDVDVVPGALTVSGSILLPVGSDGFTLDEMTLAGAIAADLLPFRISHWGAGGGGGISLVGMHSFGPVGVTADAGYTRTGEFDAVSDQPAAYRPGDALHFGLTVDRIIQGTGKAALRVDARRYGDAELGGENIFRSGNRLGATGSYAFPVGLASSGIVYLGYRHRSEGTFLVDLETRPSQGAFLVGGGVRTGAWGGVITPSVDLRAIRRDDGIGQGWSVGAGATGEWDIDAVTLLPALRLHLGSAEVREDLSSGFTGIELSFQLRSASNAR